MGFDWIKGKVATLEKKNIKKYHHGTFLGLGLMVVTGLFLFWPMREFLLTRPQFYVKMGFVLALLINGIIIGNLSTIATQKSFTSLSFKEKIPLFVSGAISTISWLGAIIMAGFLIPE